MFGLRNSSFAPDFYQTFRKLFLLFINFQSWIIFLKEQSFFDFPSFFLQELETLPALLITLLEGIRPVGREKLDFERRDESLLLAHLRIFWQVWFRCKEQNQSFSIWVILQKEKAFDWYLRLRIETCSYGKKWVWESSEFSIITTFCHFRTIKFSMQGTNWKTLQLNTPLEVRSARTGLQWKKRSLWLWASMSLKMETQN